MMKRTILICAIVIGMAHGKAQQFGFGNQGFGNQGFGQGIGGGQIIQEQINIQRRPNGEIIETIHEVE